ncbi:hypothetical protein ASPWEDRAFT_115904 [Aspergillus wentii DTO 134E9]|uniref:Cobalamin-independent methionine synthase MetE C-terminal/archaeal domain-containing protein n=1 Tax=Aspergillus wentii DTO 134E9 TaxID=1073089 RepID=A0A1L9RFA1_ASPWE|nr:uncharacterized protein ASPWEDRAFT_115904 [Aspergillus wentii DTO 134E9]KAI9926268.1 hypothetical protein MW887_004732 [Aspergillus wentii]OJJ33596.1 hypothetical protein ASPWEDRAFT_115904 [Aspergillus wentii DTO 134E9]
MTALVRAEHLGSLLRPRELLEYPNVASEQTKRQQLEDDEITKVIEKQLDLGFASITDGEYRRSLFWGSFFEGLEGFDQVPFDEKVLRTYFPSIKALLESGYRPGGSLLCTGKIKHPGTNSSHRREFEALKRLVPTEDIPKIKLTIPAPSWYHMRFKHGQAYLPGVYPSDKEYFADLAVVYQTELRDLYDAGLRRVQIDDPQLSYFCSDEITESWRNDPIDKAQDPDELLDGYIQWYNQCLSQVPPDMHIGIHICRGNFTDGRYWSSGGYDQIASKLFKYLNVNTYYLEYDSPRAGGFEPLGDLPLDKNAILGVVTTKSAELEAIEELRERVLGAATVIAKGNNVSVEEGLQRLGVSPQCGFASHCREDRLTREEMWAKLQLVRTLADSIWPGEA